MAQPLPQAHPFQCLDGSPLSQLSAYPAVNKRKFNIADCIQIRDKVKSLKDKSDLLIADIRQFVIR